MRQAVQATQFDPNGGLTTEGCAKVGSERNLSAKAKAFGFNLQAMRGQGLFVIRGRRVDR